VLTLPGCQDERPAGKFHLSTTAYDPDRRLLFMASTPGIRVFRVEDSHGSSGPRFVTTVGPQVAQVLRLAIDRRHRRLWVAGLNAIRAYDSSNYQLAKQYAVAPSGQYDRFSDLAVNEHGDVYVLARGGARIYLIHGTSLQMEPWLDIDDRAINTAIALANRFILSPDGRYLVAASSVRNQLLRIDVQTRTWQAIQIPELTVDFTCAIFFWNDERASGAAPANDFLAMSAFDCLGWWEADIRLAKDLSTGSIRASRGEIRPRLGSMIYFPAQGTSNQN
jgi:hypothetical protein